MCNIPDLQPSEAGACDSSVVIGDVAPQTLKKVNREMCRCAYCVRAVVMHC